MKTGGFFSPVAFADPSFTSAACFFSFITDFIGNFAVHFSS